MTTPIATPLHTYSTHLVWTGSTRIGYRSYTRTHRAIAPPAAEIMLSADPHFRGRSGYMNPEQLLVMAASSCQLLSFLSVAAQHHIDVLDYEDDAYAEMPDSDEPMRFTCILLNPVITVATGTDQALVLQLVHDAHHDCYIANTLNADVIIEATVVNR